MTQRFTLPIVAICMITYNNEIPLVGQEDDYAS